MVSTTDRPSVSGDERAGVLLTAFGGPDSLDAVGPFMERLMGREPAPALVDRARAKYEAIGGSSPLLAIARSIAADLERALRGRGYDAPVRVGMRYWDPSIPSAMATLVDEGATRVVMISLSAFESKVTCGAYRDAAKEAASTVAVTSICEAPSLHETPAFRDFFGRELREALERTDAVRPIVVMTAHSLPHGDLEDDDPYVAGLRAVAAHAAGKAGLGKSTLVPSGERWPGPETHGSLEGAVPWLLAYQSKGARPGGWLGPDLGQVLEAAAASGHDLAVVCPIGFATDHMETLYDLDVEARKRAEALGMGFCRVKVPNDDPALVEGLAELIVPFL